MSDYILTGIVSLATILISFGSAVFSTAIAEEMMIVQVDQAPIKGGTEVLARVNRGTRLWSFKTNGDWHQVKIPGKETKGWIHKGYISVIALTQQQVSMDEEAVRLRAEHNRLVKEGKIRESIPYFERSNALQQQIIGREHPSTALRLAKIGHLYARLKDFAKAESLYQDALDIERTVLGENHHHTETTFNNLARYYEKRGKYDKAETLQQKSLEIIIRLEGEEHLETAYRLTNLGVLYKTTRQYAKAEPLLQRALKIREKLLGNEHATTAISVNNLATLYEAMGNDAKAEEFHLRALAIKRKVLGNEHNSTAISMSNLGLFYKTIREYEKAERLLTEALEIRTKVSGAHHSDTALVMNNLAILYRKTRRYDKAEPLYLHAIAINRKVHGEEHLDTALNFHNLAVLFQESEAYDKAEPLYQRALEIRKLLVGEEHLDTATTIGSLGSLYEDIGDYAKAEAMRSRALEITRGILGDEHTETASCLRNLAGVYLNIADYSRTKPLYDQALEISLKLGGEEHPDTALCLNDLGVYYSKTGNLVEAERVFAKALDTRTKVFGRKHLSTAASLVNLGKFYKDMGDYRQAESLYQQCVDIEAEVLGKGHVDTTTGLSNLAGLYRSKGELSKASLLDHQVLEIRRTVLGEEHPDTAMALHNLGNLLSSMGQYKKAEAMALQALEIKRKVFGDSVRTAHTLTLLGRIYRDTHDYQKAEEYEHECLKIRERTLPANHPDLADSLEGLGLAFIYQKKDYAQAEALFRRALEIKQKAFGDEHPATAQTLNNLGFLFYNMQRYDDAEAFYRQSIELRTKLLGEAHPITALTMDNLAGLFAEQGEWESAADWFERLCQVGRRHVTRILPGLSSQDQLTYLRKKANGNFHRSLALGLQDGRNQRLVDVSANCLLNGKAVAAESLAEKTLLLRQVTNEETKEQADELISIRSQLATLGLKIPDAAQKAGYEQTMTALLDREAGLSRELGVAVTNPDRQDDWFEMETLRASIPANAVLIDIARFQIYDFSRRDPQDKSSHWKPAHYVAWVIPPKGNRDIRVVDLGDAAEIDEAIQSARESIGSSPRFIAEQGESESEQATRDVLAKLCERVLKPVLAESGDATELIISPDGLLWLVPWAALPIDDKRYAVEKYSMRFVASGRDLTAKETPKSTDQGRPVIMANPDYDLRVTPDVSADTQQRRAGSTSTSLLPRVSRLPGTESEARAIVPSLTTVAGGQPQMFLDKQAREGTFRELDRPPILVLSTHGFFLKDQTVEPSEQVGRSEDQRSVLATDGQQLENPLLRCGLMLAGCNHRSESIAAEADDGVLTGLEIVGTDLSGTELVVLSACETGLGDVQNGEGVAGLRQAFQLAGAKSVVSTLWQIADDETARLMTEFFKNLAAGMKKSEALRQAQLTRINARRERHGAAHPFFWAAFTLTGDD